MPLTLRFRLSVMMFIQFFIWGAWYVAAPSYLSRIGYTGVDIGGVYAAGPIAGMITPLFVGIIADRYFAIERVLGVLHLGGAALMFGATQMMQGSDPSPSAINWMLLAYMLCYFPTLALTNSLSMRNIDDAERQFPAIRVLGTLGWIAAGLSVGYLDWDSSINMFHMATGSSVLLGIYSFTLPNTPPATDGKPSIKSLLGLDALVLLKNPPFAVFMVSSVLICIPLAFYYQMAERTVQASGITDAVSKMTLGQASEIIFMLVMPIFFARLGVKWMLFVGMAAWVLRYFMFAIGVPAETAWMVLGGIVLHGICYDFFFVTGQIYTDQTAPKQIRSQAQGLLVLCTLGLGMFIGAKVAGEIETRYTTPKAVALQEQAQEQHEAYVALERQADATPTAAIEEQLAAIKAEEDRLALAHLKAIDWGSIWMFPAFAAAAVLLLFTFAFRLRPNPKQP